MTSEILAIIFALIIALAYHFGNQFIFKKKNVRNKLISFSAGISVTYLILELFPRFTAGALEIGQLIFLSVLFGFITHHLIEKNIYQHHHLKQDLKRLLSLEENIFSFFYHLIVGVLMIYLLKGHLVDGLLFFIPILSFTLINSLTTEPHISLVDSILNSSACLIGVISTIFIYDHIPAWFFYSILGFIIGIMMFSITRHHVPFGKKGKPEYFFIAFVIYSIIIIVSWYV